MHTQYSAPYSVTAAVTGADTTSKELIKILNDKVTPANPDIITAYTIPNPNGGSDAITVETIYVEN